MTTYTIATCNVMLIAIVPDDGDIGAAIREEEEKDGFTFDPAEIKITKGCILTNDLKEGDKIIYRGKNYGILTDEHGRTWNAAVIRKS
jgi:hypothetical protein